MPANRNKSNEVAELENAFHSLAEKNAQKKNARRARAVRNRTIGIVCVCLVVVIILLAVAGWYLYQDWYENRQITANLTIAGVDVTGMTRTEAELAVNTALQADYTVNSMIVSIEDNEIRIPYSISSVTMDVPAIVDAALRCQNDGPVSAMDITAFMTINEAGIREQLQKLIDSCYSVLTHTTAELVGEATAEVIVPAVDSTLPKLVVTIGTPGISVDIDDLYDRVLYAYNDCRFHVDYPIVKAEPDTIDLDALYNTYYFAPVDAQMDPETFEVSGGFHGYELDLESARVKLERAKYGDVFEVGFRWIPPKITAEEVASILFRDVLANYTTKAGSVSDRNVNLSLACKAINGMILYPGDIFSYNEALGERTIEKGYRPGISYINGESVLDIGGGICQVSSTLFYCSVVADLKIVERWNHGYASAYTPLSTDATVFWGGVDFRFQNNTEYPIRIEASSNKGNVTIKLIGTDTKDYYVKFLSERLEVIPYEEEYKEFEADNEKGYKDGDVIVTPYTGYVSKSYRAKYDKETNKLIEKTLECYDRYSSRNKVIAKIIGTEPPVIEPTPTDPPAETPNESTGNG